MVLQALILCTIDSKIIQCSAVAVSRPCRFSAGLHTAGSIKSNSVYQATRMGDEEEPQCKVEYLDIAEGGEPEETNWIRRAGKCRVTYPNGHIFEGTVSHYVYRK
jgi:hypothetical protein